MAFKQDREKLMSVNQCWINSPELTEAEAFVEDEHKYVLTSKNLLYVPCQFVQILKIRNIHTTPQKSDDFCILLATSDSTLFPASYKLRAEMSFC